MKTLRTIDDTMDFEAWAIMLLWRKVPDTYHHLINSEVVHNGATILERGEAFEVRLGDRAAHEEILVTPFPPLKTDTAAQTRWHA